MQASLIAVQLNSPQWPRNDVVWTRRGPCLNALEQAYSCNEAYQQRKSCPRRRAPSRERKMPKNQRAVAADHDFLSVDLDVVH